MKIRNLAFILITALFFFGSFAYADLPVQSNLMAWYSVDSFSGSSGGELINVWTNRTGNSDLDLTILGSVSPVFATTGFNGGPSVHFSTNTPMGTVTGIGLTGDPEFTVVFVGTVTALSGHTYTHPWAWGDGSGETGHEGGAADFEIETTGAGPRVDFATGYSWDATTPDGSFSGLLGQPVIVSYVKSPGPLNSTTRISINGTSQPITGSGNVPSIVDTPFHIGPTYAQYGAQSPTMDVAEVIIYNRVLIDTEIEELETYLCRKYGLSFCGVEEQCTPVTSGIVSWWPGDGDFADIQDGNDGISAGGVSFTTGKVDQAFYFNANLSNSFITIPDSQNLLPATNKLTIHAWIKPTFGPQNGLDTILAKRDGCISADLSYHLDVVKNRGVRPVGQISFVLGNSTCEWVIEAHSGYKVVPDDGKFHHVAGTYDGSVMKVYLDGKPVGQNSRSGSLCATTSSAFISRHGGTCGVVSWAAIDEISFHDRALSAEEIQAIFSVGSAGNCKLLDSDGDGIHDDEDNCPNIPNVEQLDSDLDGIGDDCDPDDDNDGVFDTSDNCLFMPNPDQEDNDMDFMGDACDYDDDNDGVSDITDNCPFVANTDQSDIDSDGLGDLCDSDPDGDGFVEDDNCPYTPNLLQEDNDNDGLGDVCDYDDDNDRNADVNDNCPLTANAEQDDLDGDNIGDACDIDIDGDGIVNNTDNCPLVSNVGQDDTDLDGFGDYCDDDDDSDGVLDNEDNCSLMFNPDQSDMDEDGQGDACDGDFDGDGLNNEVDNCPLIANGDQNDWDGDSLGDVCDNDIDGDGVFNDYDECDFTPVGEVIDPSSGCAIEELAPCASPRGTTETWKNHGQYVSTLAKTANSFLKDGLITEEEKDAIMSEGANSDCGK